MLFRFHAYIAKTMFRAQAKHKYAFELIKIRERERASEIGDVSNTMTSTSSSKAFIDTRNQFYYSSAYIENYLLPGNSFWSANIFFCFPPKSAMLCVRGMRVCRPMRPIFNFNQIYCMNAYCIYMNINTSEKCHSSMEIG